jgi:hypothetical protein
MLLEALELPTKVIGVGMAAGIAGITAAVVKAIDVTQDWATELDSIGDIMGGTSRDAAALNFVLRKSGTDTGTLTKGVTILSKGLVDANGKLDTTGKSLKEWGINVFDANGVLKDQTTLLGDIGDKYNSFATQQEKVNFLTEVFGRSGAELIDFFDVMASEGGISAVTKRVEELGLAIDPDRYEQFNRNLEELKLIGLGLAVSFTEKVMPALETFLDWFTDFAADPDVGKLAGRIDTFVGRVVQGMADSINEWASGSGPQELSDQIVSWIEDIGTGGEIDSKMLTAAGNLVEALGRALMSIDWGAIDAALDEWDARILAKFDEWDASILATFDQWDASILAKFDEWDASILATFDEWDAAINAKVADALSKLIATAGAKLSQAGLSFTTWATVTVPAALASFSSSLVTTVNAAMTEMSVSLENKMREVAKMFFNRAMAWTQQAKAGFNSGLGGLLEAVGGIVDEVNKVLRKIITSFTISIKLPSLPGLPGSPSNPPGGGGSIGGGNRPPGHDRRASGGPVIGGQAYSVSEFFRPEVFVPGASGRVDPLGASQMQFVQVTNWDGFDYTRLASEIIKAQNNA